MRRLAVLLALVLGFAACGGSDSGSSPSSPSTPSTPTTPIASVCCNYPTSYTYEMVVSDGTQVALQATGTFSSAFDRTRATLTTNGTLSASAPSGGTCAVTTSTIATYRSVADFVDEGRSLGKRFVRTVTATNSVSGPGACGSATPYPTGTTTFTYDAQDRLMGDGTFTYTAWDSSGRPTLGTAPATAGLCGPQSVEMSYDDAGRIVTTILSATICATGRLTSTTVFTYDNNMNQISARTTTAGSNGLTTQVFRIGATAQVCK